MKLIDRLLDASIGVASAASLLLLVIYLLVAYQPPQVALDAGFINDCKSVDWITDACAESTYYGRFN